MHDTIERLTSALSDRYAIERELGAGGMATVYLADDLKHHRKVAVKVLRPELAIIIGSQRFLTEIRVTANLQHPHILPLHDSGEVDGFLFYVMPFIDGESLRDRLSRETQLSVEDALLISQEVADGLSYAHSLGVVHRDIKPENILLTGGHALIADFGIARAVTEAGGTRLTETGLSLGTPHYMSPEQASGERDVDARSDVYALGCVTYEMLVGEPPHTGPNAQAIIAKVLTQPVRSVRDSRELVPPQVDSAIKKALAKLPADRFATVRQFADGLRMSGSATWEDRSASNGVTTQGSSLSKPLLLAWSVVGLLSVLVLALVLWPSEGSSNIEGVTRLTLDPKPAGSISIGAVGSQSAAEADMQAISADGRTIAFVGRLPGDTTTHIFIRDLDKFEARRLPETESASSPFFSPDGQWLGFYSWADRRLKIVPVTGGLPQVICECEPILSADWGPDGTIIMDSDGIMGLRVVASSGGTPEVISFRDRHLEEDEYALAHPQFLPDGKHVLLTAWGGGGGTRRVAVFSLEDSERTTLLEDGWGPRYVENGFLVYQRSNQLWAVTFDIDRLEVSGTPVQVLDSAFAAPFTTLYSISKSGTLVYAPGPVPDPQTSIFLVGRSGQMDRIPTDAGSWTIWGPRLSPSGNRIVFSGADPSGMSEGQASSRVWMYDNARTGVRALTDAGPGDYWPIWAPDGRSVVFGSFRGARLDIYRVLADGSGTAELLFSDDSDKQPYSWLPGGDGLMFQRQGDPAAGFDIWLLPLTGDSTAVPLVNGPASETHPAISPDGRWLAYASDQSGQYEVYLRRYPELDELQQVSNSGGMAPLWRSDSRELYFYSGTMQDHSGTTFMRVRIDDSPGTPEPMWSHASIFSTGLPYGSGYDMTPDGQQMLVSINEGEYPLFLPEMRIVFNWVEELRSVFGR